MSDRKQEVNDALEKLMSETIDRPEPVPLITKPTILDIKRKSSDTKTISSRLKRENSGHGVKKTTGGSNKKERISEEYIFDNSDEGDDIDSDEKYAQQLQAFENSSRRRTTTIEASNKSKKKLNKKKKKEDEEDGEKKPKNFRPMYCSAELQDLIGVFAVPRTQATKLIWDYIKSHNLQDPHDKRSIICDDKLQAVFKTEKLNMFQIAKSLTLNLSHVPDEELDDVKKKIEVTS